jgi:hypothetical protein
MKHYTYKITDPVTGEFYFGSRSHNNPEVDSYMGSYRVWEPEDKSRLIREIIRDDFVSREDVVENEAELISEYINDILNRNYYIPDKGFHTLGLDVCSKDSFIKRYGNEEGIKRHTKWLDGIKNTMKKKMKSMSKLERRSKFGFTGESNPNYGNAWSEDWKREQSKRMKEYYKKHEPPRKGATHTEEAKQKLSEFRKEYYKNNPSPNKGNKYTEDQKNNIRESLKTQPRVTCPYCGITTNKGNAQRWHFDNCKSRLS